MPGLLLDGKPEGLIESRENCKVAVYNVGFDLNATEASATVLFKSSKELQDFSLNEDKSMEEIVKAIADLGVGVVICSGKSSPLMLHYANKYNIVVLTITSKHMIRRVCYSLGARPSIKMEVPNKENLGYIDEVKFLEIHEQNYIKIYRKDSIISSIVLFGTTDQLLQQAEEAVSSGINILKVLARDPRLVAGAGSFEIELAKVIRDHSIKNFSGELTSYVYESVASALEKIPKYLIENTGIHEPGQMITSVFQKHQKGQTKAGIFVDEDYEVNLVDDVSAHGIKDSLFTKLWAMKYAFNALDQICRVDQIIMAKESDFRPRKPDEHWDHTEKDM